MKFQKGNTSKANSAKRKNNFFKQKHLYRHLYLSFITSFKIEYVCYSKIFKWFKKYYLYKNFNVKYCQKNPIEVSNVKINIAKKFLFKNYPDKYIIISLCSAVIQIQKSVIWHQWRCQMSKKILSKNFSSKMIQIGILSSRHVQQ